ncbi:hypothetical protein U0070_007957 [Myodes glareolus]|uniref:Receptor activity-modifying protein 1 n=1 Tax=Myodes glareolus TaxID=447135 RepID=A0AAW0IGY9_MYOGA
MADSPHLHYECTEAEGACSPERSLGTPTGLDLIKNRCQPCGLWTTVASKPCSKSYGDLTFCTKYVADNIGCFWPNPEVDKFFITIHHLYFSQCPVSGRALQDPPNSILCPFIMLPITVTLLMTALVVWRSKHTEGIV